MIDVAVKLAETKSAIETMRQIKMDVPEEAFEMLEIFERCLTAEKLVETNLESQLSLGKEAYEAYARHTGFKSLATGADLPQWEGLPEAIKNAWMVSAAWVAGRVLRKFGVSN